MRRLLLAAGGGGEAPVAPVDPVEPEPLVDPLDADPGTLPYAHRTAAPWNAPEYAITPTPDGTGSVVHPDVVDFLPITETGTWNGWRFWMAVMPYWLTDGSKENPIILVSSDGYTWQTPTGADPEYLFLPLRAGIQSDTDLAYDPDEDRLIMTWRESHDHTVPSYEWVYASTSTNGTTWTPRVELWVVEGPGGGLGLNVSQALVRVGPGDWRAWVRNKPAGTNGGIALRTATNPLGPWSAPTQCVMNPFVGENDERFWHLDVIHHNGRFYGYFSYTRNLPATSTDGINWTIFTSRNIPQANTSSWDASIYRGTIQPHIDGEQMRVWYSSDGPDSWRVGYTIVPLTLWD